ncbi:MAG: glutamine--tRNA ligase/YqeY domain fusion protein [Phycisphaerae bacterium]|nr:MAG: glutamine--tRNA ligase/YqeY domain fusion protein [Planctomycetota bacterium]MBE7458029.1 glutamine--tRNA ligase/YqeY domain fusion protein [Planctomycetia bacterium]MCL4720311.1 glutamine--tRNA ligase/YqeY domain fusion protein [Phycisphaerae bacterium]
MEHPESHRPLNFIEEIIEADNAARKWGTWPDGRPKVCTRFPPEPNGYLHIGHAKSICLNYGLAEKYGGRFHLRFDDTNPVKEEMEYIESIANDVRWLGARWPGMRDDDPLAGVLFASDYFEQMVAWAIELIKKGKAFVCDLTGEQVREYRGTLTAPGRNSPYRNRSIEENLDLFHRMRAGEFPDGSRTLRAKIDMTHPNLNLRDPVIYRILHAPHPHAGDKWCIYPMYDWAHGFEDSIEGITHSICTLEFEDHRPLYDWFIDAVNEGRTDDGSGPWGKKIHHPQQIEFARGELTHVVTSKRKLLELVKEGYVRGWDDPRMPTLAGLRRRGYTPASIRRFWTDLGVARFKSTIEYARLEHAVRDDLNKTAPRVMAVLRPLKVVITNWNEQSRDREGAVPPVFPTRDREGTVVNAECGMRNTECLRDPRAGRTDWLDAVNNPEDKSAGTRKVPFSGVLYIERDDFRETPPPKYWRLFPGNEVRLRWAYLIKCTGFVKDPTTGDITEVHCTYDPATRGGDASDGRKVKSTIHWVSAAHALDAEVRLYEHLFLEDDSDNQSRDREGASSRPPAAGKEQVEVSLRRGEGVLPAPPGSGAEAARIAKPAPSEDAWKSALNLNSLETIPDAKVEPSLADAAIGATFQFERNGYFCVDPDSDALIGPYPSGSGASPPSPRERSGEGLAPDPTTQTADRPRRLVFNRTVTLKDTWAKIEKKA